MVKESCNKAHKKYRDNNPIKTKAREKLYIAFRGGHITRPITCVKCNSTQTIECHHLDYNKPLEFVGLCRICHNAEHTVLPKGE